MTALPATDLYPQSSLSGGVFGKGLYTRVFYQKNDGTITAVLEDAGKGFVDSKDRILVTGGVAKLGTPLTTVNFLWKGDLRSRTYFLGKNNELYYGAMDKGVPSHKAVNDGKVIAAANSQIGAFGWVVNDVPHLRVYFQKPDNTIQELTWDGADDPTYSLGLTMPAVLPGTSLAFVNQSVKDADHYSRGFYQSDKGIIKEHINEPKYDFVGTNIFDLPIAKSSRLTASVAPTARGKGQVGVYWQDGDGGVSRCVLDNDSGLWHRAERVPEVKTEPGRGFLALSWNPDGSKEVNERIVYIGKDGVMRYALL